MQHRRRCEHADHRHQQCTDRRGGRRQPFQCGEPADVTQAELNHRHVGHRRPAGGRERGKLRMLDREADDHDRQAAEADLPGRQRQWRHRQREMLGQHGAERNAYRACQRTENARQLSDAGLEAVAADQHDDAGERDQKRNRAQRRQPFAEDRPRHESDPDRDRYSEHGGFAGAEPEQGQPHECDPSADLQRRDQQQAQPHRSRHAELLLPCTRNQCERGGADDTAQTARGQRRPLGQKMLHDREVEPPPHRRDGEKDKPERRRSGASRLANDRHVKLDPGGQRICSCSDTATRNSRYANSICTISYRRAVAVPT